MPKGLREIRNRIKSVKSTGQITRAMQLVASSKMKRAQDSARAGRAYAELLGEILDTAQSKVGDFTHPLLTKRDVKVRGILLVTPDKGMAGALNGNLIRLAAEQKDAVFVCIGRKGAQALARSGRKVLADFPVTDRANFSEVRPAAEYLLKAFLRASSTPSKSSSRTLRIRWCKPPAFSSCCRRIVSSTKRASSALSSASLNPNSNPTNVT